ncbi:MAG: NADH:ubiquinone reductase (Na(+)-transporting) subunit B [Planctomyces sp.]|uniref:Na(+)-translocating NADH-quinone reductase subunit B n=1 Tax=Rubinisphaera brasiliensis (strain ATCC 49424 / DSM 5305 / JCM 21570 / IAM 15109 / NBRC 103401 / IFAM 1448) TaxID=756272 RepID=F0SRP1_RUBBR|nr:NADH:ubiquinone reductase (Na(+)-transporting) subunit B [Rubinisphaera brasiliensis]ADY59164.1 NADH:ubiquinone oxidoreductase, subunit B [Rubinisphaera brasiliensis DSM 5305]MBB02627.1 NADH:ubiquinone reductase (Na(+)-transporting) subunit B [Planctomyces sp.]
MKPLRQLLDKAHPLFTRGGKLELFYPLYEAGDTFLYTPGEVTTGPSHVRDALDLKRMMITVVGALVPCIFMAMWNTGYQANLVLADLGVQEPEGWRGAFMAALGLAADPSNQISNLIHGALYFVPLFLVANIAGGLFEVLFSVVRKHEINEGFLVTGMLYPLTLPPTMPWWQAAIGIIFAVVLAKEVFGGTGKNFVNIALTARAFLYFAYPTEISGDKVWTAVDGYSGATALGAMGSLASADAGLGMTVVTNTGANGGLGMSWIDAFLGVIPGSMGETSALAAAIGAVILIATGIGSWRIMAAVTIGLLGTSAGLYAIGSDTNAMFAMPPHWHLVVGGFAFGCVFMATDPVSAAFTNGGKWIYGLLIGFMTVLIRVINPAFPEGIMLAILFGNVFAPLIDYFFIQANIKRRLARSHVPA